MKGKEKLKRERRVFSPKKKREGTTNFPWEKTEVGRKRREKGGRESPPT